MPSSYEIGSPDDQQILASWQAELSELDGPARDEFMQALGGLASPPVVEVPVTEKEAPPPGFTSWQHTESGATLLLSQFESRMRSLTVDAPELTIDVVELTSDTGEKLRVGDLRPFMARSLSKVGPKTELHRKKLDAAFWRDMKTYADTGRMFNSVTQGADRVGYTKVGDSKLRTYWTAANDKQNIKNVPTVVRIGDVGDNEGLEAKFYRKMFDAKL